MPHCLPNTGYCLTNTTGYRYPRLNWFEIPRCRTHMMAEKPYCCSQPIDLTPQAYSSPAQPRMRCASSALPASSWPLWMQPDCITTWQLSRQMAASLQPLLSHRTSRSLPGCMSLSDGPNPSGFVLPSYIVVTPCPVTNSPPPAVPRVVYGRQGLDICVCVCTLWL